MTMELVQVRLPEKLVSQVDVFVKRGYYASKSDVIRDAIRRLVLEKQVGSVANSTDSIQEVHAVRKKLSVSDVDLKEINAL